MHRTTFALMGTAALLSVSLGCGSSSPLSSTSPGSTGFTGSLKAKAPTAVSPVDSQLVSDNTLTATAATTEYGAIALQYRFQVFSDTGNQVLDSGPVDSPAWTMTIALTPNSRFTWTVRAEYQGTPGAWSAPASFVSGDPLPAFGPVGDWEHCAGLTSTALVVCVHAVIRPVNSVGDMEVVKRVAWLLRGDGAGLLIKGSGDNVVLWQGYAFSASRVCFADGHLYKIITDAGPGGSNAPGFGDNGFVDPATCVPAIDPSKP